MGLIPVLKSTVSRQVEGLLVLTGMLAVAVLFAVSGVASAQPLVPLNDEVSSPLLPTGIIRQDVHVSGQLAYLWKSESGSEAGSEAGTEAGEQVAHVVGDFELVVGGRRLSAQQAVVWMIPRRLEGAGPQVSPVARGDLEYQQFEIFLYRDARIVEPAGTLSEGPVLFATLNTIGELFVSADKRTFVSSADTTVYRDASSVRMRVREASGDDRTNAPITGVAGFPVEKTEKIPRAFRYDADLTQMRSLEDGVQVAVGVGNVNVFVGSGGDGYPFEARAGAVVVFFASPEDEVDSGTTFDGSMFDDEDDALGMSGSGVEAIYLEGDIRLTSGDRTIRASRIYYDLKHDRALILDVVMFAMVPDRNLPIYIRANQVRQLSDREFLVQNGSLTTSEFHTPHYHIAADRVQIVDRTPRSFSGEAAGLGRASYRMEGVSFKVGKVPFFYWPGVAGNVRISDTALRGISIGQRSNFGMTVRTRWDLFNLLSFETPAGFNAEFRQDYFSDRGPAVGLDVSYERASYYGLYRGYMIDDRGEDNLGRLRDNTPDKQRRGRTTLRHRQFFPDDWELTFELSYISDRGFLEEYFEREFDRDKEQETVFYAKKQRDNWAFTATAQYRLNSFETRTESLPDFSFRRIGQPVGDFATSFSESRVGAVRYRAAKKEFYLFLTRGSDGASSGGVVRSDTRHEIQFPMDLGPVRLAPFLVARNTSWDDSLSGGGTDRLFVMGGIRGSMYFSKVFPDVRSEMWDLDGLRHVIKADAVAWVSASNLDSDELYPFDERVEGIDDFDGITLGLRQRLQTKRGPAGDKRTVNFLKFDIELGLFNNVSGRANRSAGDLGRYILSRGSKDGGLVGRSAFGGGVTNGFTSYTRPENSIARNFVNTSLKWQINDGTALLSEMNYDINDGEVDIFNLSLAVDRTPRFSYALGYRFIEESDSNLLGFAMNYKIDRKHSLAFREEFDLGRGQTLDFSIAYIRKYPRWYVAWIFDLDDAEDIVGLSFSIWPEGLDKVALGSRRFTGLATSMGITRN